MIVPVPYLRGQLRFGLAVDELLAHAAIGDQLLDRDDRQVVLPGQLVQLRRDWPDRPMSFEDFAQHAGGQQPGHAGQIDGRFGVSGAAEHAALFGHERKQVARAIEIGRLAVRIANRLDRRRPFGGRDAGPASSDGRPARCNSCRAARCSSRPSGGDSSRSADLGQDRHAELPAALRDHEVDRLGRGLFGGTDEVALVFAVFGIDDDDDSPLANGLDGFVDRGKRVLHVEFLSVRQPPALPGVLERIPAAILRRQLANPRLSRGAIGHLAMGHGLSSRSCRARPDQHSVL